MFDHKHYNRKWIANAQSGFPPENDAADYGVVIHKTDLADDYFWRVNGVHHLFGLENKGNHHIYCDVLDLRGNRVVGAKLISHVGNRQDYATVDKPPNEPGTNFPLWSFSPVSVSVRSEVNDRLIPSDTVSGMHFGHADEDEWNTIGHHSFYVCFQLAKAKRPDPVIVPPIQQPQPEPLQGRDFTGQIAIDDTHYVIRIPREAVDIQQARQRITHWAEAA